jgi:hypothetical protein
VDTSVFARSLLPFRKPTFTLVGIYKLAAIETIGVEVDNDRVPILDEGDRAAEEGLRRYVAYHEADGPA